MESLKSLYQKIIDEVDKFDIDTIEDDLKLVGMGQMGEILEFSGRPNGYYKWLHCFTKMMRPKQVVELGAAAGISTIMMATGNPDTQIISIDCDPQAWRWMDKEYPNVKRILGDDLDLDNF